MNTTRLEDVIDKTGMPTIDPETRRAKSPIGGLGTISRFSAPKSVSLYLAVNEDKVVEQMITEAVDETMAAIEARMETKDRKGYQEDNRLSPAQR